MLLLTSKLFFSCIVCLNKIASGNIYQCQVYDDACQPQQVQFCDATEPLKIRNSSDQKDRRPLCGQFYSRFPCFFKRNTTEIIVKNTVFGQIFPSREATTRREDLF